MSKVRKSIKGDSTFRSFTDVIQIQSVETLYQSYEGHVIDVLLGLHLPVSPSLFGQLAY